MSLLVNTNLDDKLPQLSNKKKGFFSLVYSAFFFLFEKLAAIVINKEEVIQTVKALDVKVPSFHPPIIW